jgi:membrane-associated phospholipid phosphatase
MENLDHQLLKTINRDWENSFFDLFFVFWTDVQKTAVFYFLIAFLFISLMVKKKWSSLIVILIAASGAFLADLLNSKLLKPIFERARPTDVILRTSHQGSFSFPSSHAVDAFFIATFLGFYFPKLRIWMFALAALTALSRVYCGVHYPGDILAGAAVGFVLGKIFIKGIEMTTLRKKLNLLTCILCMIFTQSSFAKFKDPTEGKPFFPWAWEDQLKPTIKKSVDPTGLTLIAVGGTSTLLVHQYDGKIFNYSESGGNLLMDQKTATNFGKLGNGLAGVSIAALQIVFDQENGLKTSRAFILASTSHIALSAIARRNRPQNRNDFLPWPSSFPSGHTTSAFVLAGSLAYSYGWAGGVPGYLIASSIAISRVRENRHWASDIFAGAFLGTFWARASFRAEELDKEAFIVVPLPVYDGLMIAASREF